MLIKWADLKTKLGSFTHHKHATWYSSGPVLLNYSLCKRTVRHPAAELWKSVASYHLYIRKWHQSINRVIQMVTMMATSQNSPHHTGDMVAMIMLLLVTWQDVNTRTELQKLSISRPDDFRDWVFFYITHKSNHLAFNSAHFLFLQTHNPWWHYRE